MLLKKQQQNIYLLKQQQQQQQQHWLLTRECWHVLWVLRRQHVVLAELRPRYGYGGGREEDGLQGPELTGGLLGREGGEAGRVGGEAAPLAAHPGEALRAPAGLPAPAALGVGGQVALLRGKRRWIG